MRRPPRLNKCPSDRGIYITLVAVFGLVLLGFVALVIQLGLAAAAQSRLQLVANLAALSAIEQYVRFTPADGDQNPLEDSRRNATTSRANSILQANSVWGLDSSRFELEPGATSGSRIVFGTWHRFDPDGSGGVSCQKYPCFVPFVNAEAISGNAVRLVVESESDNPFTRFLGSIFGPDTLTIRAEATATLVKRCMAFLVDLSLTSTNETHAVPGRTSFPTWRGPSEPLDPLRESVGFYGDLNADNAVTVYDPSQKGIPAFPGGAFPLPFPMNLGLYAYVDPPSACDYTTLTPAVGQINYSALYWCSLLRHRDFITDPELPDSGRNYRTRADYRLVETPFSQNAIYFDSVTRPEPFSTYLLAFNAALRSVYAVSSNADEAMFAGFSKAIPYQNVNRRYPQSGLTRNIPLLVHLTNMNNVGGLDSNGDITGVNPPTFIDLGIFPVFGSTDAATASNLAGVIKQTAGMLGTTCGPSDRKVIVLATDGLGNCTQYGNSPTYCSPTWFKYLSSEMLLVGTSPGGVLKELVDKQVALTVLHSGVGVRPNFRKMPTACPNGENDCLLDFDGALRAGRVSGFRYDAQGQGPYCDSPFDPNTTSFINCAARPPSTNPNASPCVSQSVWSGGCEASAFLALGEPGVYLGRVAAVMAELALRSGGRYCPILPTLGEKMASNENYFDHDGDEPPGASSLCSGCTPRQLRASVVPSADTVEYSLELLTKGEQAAECASRAVGGNPFTLVEE